MKIENLFERSDSSERQLPAGRDLMYKARTKYPSYDSQQALTLYMADKMADQLTTDLSQNKLINAQKRENEKLTNVIKSLGQELDSFEQQSQETDREVERLKQLSGTLSTGGVETQRKAKVSADDLEKLQQDLELLKSKPGMDSEKFEQLQLQIKNITSNPSMDNGDLKKLQSLVSTLEKQKTIGDDLYGKLENQLQITKKALDDKEGRFAKYIEKKKGEVSSIQSQSAEEMKQYAEIVKGYKNKIDNFEKEMSTTTSGIKNDAEEARNILNVIKQIYNTTADIDPNAIPLPKSKPVSPSVPISTTDRVSQAGVSDNAVDAGALASNTVKKAADSSRSRQFDKASKALNKWSKGIEVDQLAESIKLVEYPGDKAPPKIYKDWGDPEFNDWMRDHLHILINMFKGKFRNELARKNPTYGDGQISYDIQDEAWYLKKIFDGNDPVLTKQKMDAYLDLVKMTLFNQPVEISHQDELFKESLEKTYERMLDNVIGLSYIKKG
jgi:hypothetical protein